ncbi:MAG: hypothetical protein U9N42_08170, partial [Campylobacterota bacterium]|nr:hypothetical protein [Campylobacterota bacterium]
MLKFCMKKLILVALVLFYTLNADEYMYRNYSNVKDFYELISKNVVDLSMKHNAPPAAILAVAGLESGYGSGYVAQITGNIMSLGANKGDKQLPPLYLPYCKTDRVKITLYDPVMQKKCGVKNLDWKQRPPSYKRDYRPAPYAGTNKNLAYLKYHKGEKQKAELACVNDFLTNWLSKDYKFKVFQNARIWLDEKVKKEGKATLLTKKTSEEFIHKIGGVPNSFNYRKSWPKKVLRIMNRTGLV